MKKVAIILILVVLISPVARADRCSRATIQMLGYCPLDYPEGRPQAQSAVGISAPGPLPSEAGPVAAGLGAGLLAAGLKANPWLSAGIGVLTFGIADEVRYQRMKNDYQNHQEIVWKCVEYPVRNYPQYSHRECWREVSGIQIRTGKKNVQPH